MNQVLATPRLELFAATPAQLNATLLPPAECAAAIARPVAGDWPPLHWDEGAVNWIVGRVREEPDEPLWRPWLIALRDSGTVVGTVGCKGPPDADGAAEIGYSVVTSHWRRGIASEAAGALCAWLLTDARVKVLRAHTLANDPASSGVLRKLGFAHVATLEDPSDGTVDRFERTRA